MQLQIVIGGKTVRFEYPLNSGKKTKKCWKNASFTRKIDRFMNKTTSKENKQLNHQHWFASVSSSNHRMEFVYKIIIVNSLVSFKSWYQTLCSIIVNQINTLKFCIRNVNCNQFTWKYIWISNSVNMQMNWSEWKCCILLLDVIWSHFSIMNWSWWVYSFHSLCLSLSSLSLSMLLRNKRSVMCNSCTYFACSQE